MRLFICSIRDRAVDSFGTPFFVQAVGQAIRSFSDEVNRVASDNQFNKHPEDFDLYELGHFDTDTGHFDCHAPRMIGIGKDLIRPSEGR